MNKHQVKFNITEVLKEKAMKEGKASHLHLYQTHFPIPILKICLYAVHVKEQYGALVICMEICSILKQI